jgi:hypothetical protein
MSSGVSRGLIAMVALCSVAAAPAPKEIADPREGTITLSCSFAQRDAEENGFRIVPGEAPLKRVVATLPGLLRHAREGDRWPRANFPTFHDPDGITGPWSLLEVTGMNSGEPRLVFYRSRDPSGGTSTLATRRAGETLAPQVEADMQRSGFGEPQDAYYAGRCVVLPGAFKIE